MTQLITFHHTLREDDHITRILVTGHMVDRENRPQSRFPSRSLECVRETLSGCLDGLARAHGLLRIIMSATKGVDLLAVDFAIANGMPAEVYLPQADESLFLANAVNYGPDGPQWVERYLRARATAWVTVHTPVDATDPLRPFWTPQGGASQHYEDLNRYMAGLLRPADILLAYWDGRQGDRSGGTEHMIRVAQAGGTACLTLNTGLENADPRYDPLRKCYTFMTGAAGSAGG
jgi:hypothetical protein